MILLRVTSHQPVSATSHLTEICSSATSSLLCSLPNSSSLIMSSSNHVVDHIEYRSDNSPSGSKCIEVALICILVRRTMVGRWRPLPGLGLYDQATKDFMHAHDTPAALHDYFIACANRGVAVDEAAAMNTDNQLREEHRGFASCLQRHQYTTCDAVETGRLGGQR